jgi:hypothetical protein
MKKNKPIKPMKFEEMTTEKLAEDIFGKRLKKKLDKVAHSNKFPESQSIQK